MLRGDQVQFFMTRQDEEGFVETALSGGNIWLIRHDWYASQNCETFNDAIAFFSQPAVTGRHKTPTWLFWNRSLCPDELEFAAVSGQPFFEIRQDVNYVVEFTRSVVDGGVMKIGRLACLEGYEDHEGVFRVKPGFMKWYRSLAKWISQQGTLASFDGKQPQHKLYILPGALRHHEKGGHLGSIAGKPGAFQPLRKP